MIIAYGQQYGQNEAFIQQAQSILGALWPSGGLIIDTTPLPSSKTRKTRMANNWITRDRILFVFLLNTAMPNTPYFWNLSYV